MFAGLKFVNGYSPILASGVAKEFGFAIHGEFDWATQKKLLETAEGDQLLSKLGVDGIVVAAESGLTPGPREEWEMVFESEEGKVYHRRTSSPRSRQFVESRDSEVGYMSDFDRDGRKACALFPAILSRLLGESEWARYRGDGLAWSGSRGEAATGRKRAISSDLPALVVSLGRGEQSCFGGLPHCVWFYGVAKTQRRCWRGVVPTA